MQHTARSNGYGKPNRSGETWSKNGHGSDTEFSGSKVRTHMYKYMTQISKTWWMFRWSSGKFFDLRDFLTPGVNLVKTWWNSETSVSMAIILKKCFFWFWWKTFFAIWTENGLVKTRLCPPYLTAEQLNNGNNKKYVANYLCTCWSRAQK